MCREAAGRLTTQVSLRPRFTNHRVICPAAWITSRLQKPSSSWNTGLEYLSVLSHPPNVTFSSTPPCPKNHSCQLSGLALVVTWAIVRETQSVLPASIENRLSAQISRPGITTNCDSRTMLVKVHRIRDDSGVRSLLAL